MKPPYCQPGSLAYEQAAEFMRLSAERLAAGRAGFPAYRVAAAVWALTVPFAKGWDATFVQEIGKLANVKDRRDVGRAIKECVRLGALEWEPSRYVPPRGQPGRPSLVGLPGAPKMGATRPHLTARKRGATDPHNLSVEVMSDAVSIDTGTHHSSLVGPSGSVDGSKDWEAGRDARPQARPEPEPAYDTEALARLIEADLDTPAEPTVAERFPPYHADERTGDTTGDDEAAQLRWQGANPGKARRLRRGDER